MIVDDQLYDASTHHRSSKGMIGCRAHTELEAEKLALEIEEYQNSVNHLVRLCRTIVLVYLYLSHTPLIIHLMLTH